MPTHPPKPATSRRHAREAAALRANLQKRKEQARLRGEPPNPPAPANPELPKRV